MVQIRLLPILLLMFFSAPALGQGRYETYYMAGPVLKVVQSKFKFESNVVNVPESEPEIGYQIGGFLRARVNNLYVQPELLLSKTQNQLIFPDYDGVAGFNPKADFEFTSLNIPLDIGFYIDNFRIESGPAISVLLEGKQFFLNDELDITDDFNKVTLQYNIGVGLDLNNVLIDVNYEFGLNKTGESLRQLVGPNFRPSRSNLVFSISLVLYRHKKRQ